MMSKKYCGDCPYCKRVEDIYKRIKKSQKVYAYCTWHNVVTRFDYEQPETCKPLQKVKQL